MKPTFKVGKKSWVTEIIPKADFEQHPHETIRKLLSTVENAINVIIEQGADEFHIQWHDDFEFEGKRGCCICVDALREISC